MWGMRIKRPFKNRGAYGVGFIAVTLALLLTPVGLAGFAGYYLFLKDAQKPDIALRPEAEATSLKRRFHLSASDEQSGIRSLVVTVTQGQRRFDVLRKVYDTPGDKVSESFTLEGSELRGGPFEMQAAAADGSYANLGAGNTARLTRKMHLDLSLPVVKPLTPAHYVRQGGVGLVIYTVNKDVQKSGVLVGDLFFPGYKQKDGQYACLFAFPRELEAEAFKPRILAEDAAGNEKLGFFVNMAIKRRFREERVEVSDDVLAAKLPAFAGLFPEVRDPVERFRKINTELRRQNDATLADLAARTSPKPLWDGAFIYLPRSVVKTSFGAERVYVHDGVEIGRDNSSGIDLASVPSAPVPAANNGVVVLAGPLGVYGQTVVIDHGMGLQSLYGHLSSIAVKVGDTVTKGDVIGATGTTGLEPGGDYVHFATLLAGQPVIPIEWWDGHWIEDNVTQKFKRYTSEPES
jgi:murein DD-endopeptidase MepM/ murein hydrolase activator NlpD